MYWTKEPALETPYFKECMSYNRFRVILSLLHFECLNDDSPDVLHKIRPVLDHLITNFQAVYRPGENISIDESLLLWKGRLKFKQFNRNRRSRFGIKLYEMCESKSRYAYNVKIYAGKDADKSYTDKRIGVSGEVVKLLIGDLNEQGGTLFIDNWYTSPMLALQLHNQKTNVFGTVRINPKHLPKLNAKEIKRGQMKVFHTPKLCFVSWHDKKLVTMLTTVHVPELIDTGKTNFRTGERIQKPNVVISYNNNMGGVDTIFFYEGSGKSA
ncbi:piggyBac transposable element-derived protein 4-like [Leptopilina boulardi]|uniref:piggyBac transposable element-derived protein 4-like n=1 Tax=Leptopilina boulardi TaxID=63433 RepID=UPI0021F5CABD|nr:piggyBac transposable element-derived protein 4-like [Leptopilina boulardi]